MACADDPCCCAHRCAPSPTVLTFLLATSASCSARMRSVSRRASSTFSRRSISLQDTQPRMTNTLSALRACLRKSCTHLTCAVRTACRAEADVTGLLSSFAFSMQVHATYFWLQQNHVADSMPACTLPENRRTSGRPASCARGLPQLPCVASHAHACGNKHNQVSAQGPHRHIMPLAAGNTSCQPNSHTTSVSAQPCAVQTVA
jgi:hypothetical protein